MLVKRLRQIFNVLFVAMVILFVALMTSFVLFLISSFDYTVLFSAFDTLSAVLFLLFAGIFAVLCVMVGIVVKIGVVFHTQVNNWLDADAAVGTYAESLKIFGRRKASPGYHVLYSQILDVKGQYEEALAELLPISARLISKRNKARLAYFQLRCSQVQNAQTILQQLGRTLNPEASSDSVLLHVTGLYLLEAGELDKAENCFAKASFLAKYSFGGKEKLQRLNCEYDLARLEQKEGNTEKALEHYKIAAAMGPKTWLGQEAARRQNDMEAGERL